MAHTQAQFLFEEARLYGEEANLSAEEHAMLNSQTAVKSFLGLGIQPLFGWKLYGVAWLLMISPFVIAAAVLGLALTGHLALAALLVTVVGVLVFVLCRQKTLKQKLADVARSLENEEAAPNQPSLLKRLTNSAWKAAGIELSLVNSYHLKRRLWDHFGNDNVCCNGSTGTDVVIVAAALQSIRKNSTNQQVWAHHGFPLMEALAAACSIPRLFPPLHVHGAQAKQWLRKKELKDPHAPSELDLIDGGVIRKNPLPALFNWMRDEGAAAQLFASQSADDARIHVIYNVPIEPYDANNGQPAPDRIDLVEAALVGWLMRARRDTKLEVRQTNFLSEIRSAIEERSDQWLSAFADEIAPAREIQFSNPLEPTRIESLRSAAEGCRRTLGRCYAGAIQDFLSAGGLDFVPCHKLIAQIAPARPNHRQHPGLPEVCEQCTKQLRAYPQPPYTPALIRQSFNAHCSNQDVQREFPALCEPRPRIAFVASGGVFRGAFHIGLIAAFQALDMKPDLVVGASVGTLIGRSLGSYAKPAQKGRSIAPAPPTNR